LQKTDDMGRSEMEQKTLELYKFLIGLRKRFDALRTGEYGELL